MHLSGTDKICIFTEIVENDLSNQFPKKMLAISYHLGVNHKKAEKPKNNA